MFGTRDNFKLTELLMIYKKIEQVFWFFERLGKLRTHLMKHALRIRPI